MSELKPNRWLHLRHPEGFDEQRFSAFQAHCEVWKAYCQAVLREWSALPLMQGDAPRYVFFDPDISDDRFIVSLPLGGTITLDSRSVLENGASELLWQFFTIEFLLDLEEGITEDHGSGLVINWRRVLVSDKSTEG